MVIISPISNDFTNPHNDHTKIREKYPVTIEINYLPTFYIDIVFGAFFGMLAFDLAHVIIASAKKTIWNQKIIKSKTR